MKKMIRLFCALLICLSFPSCQKGMDEYDSSPEANMQALWEIIDQHYCFLDYKAEEIGLDWNAIRSIYLKRLSPQMSRAQLFEVLCQMLSELRDGHVNLYSSADVGRNWSWKEDYPDNLNTEVRDEYLGTDYKIAAGLKYKILGDNIGYILYESFQNGFGEGNLDEVLYYMRLCNGLVIDVRSNSGGFLTYAERFSSRFTNEKILVGYNSHKTGPGHNDFSKPEPEYLKPSEGVRWQKKVVVLTNRACFSSTNTFVRNMKECPLVTILGDKTGGGGGMPFSSEIPIGWSVRFSACPSYDARMQQIEFGIDPDVICSLDHKDVENGHDTLIDTARQMLSE